MCVFLYVVMNTGLHIHMCVFLFMLMSINVLANKPELNCTDGRDNAGLSHAATVARKAGGID